VYSELEMMGMEGAVAYFEVLSRYLHEKQTKQNKTKHKTLAMIVLINLKTTKWLI
jgi:hypothetical protein